MAITADNFRNAMRHLAGHVCIITSSDKNGSRFGCTATAVASVSAEPPSILTCINKQNGSRDAIQTTGYFGINILQQDDVSLSNRFAGKLRGEERFEEGEWITLETGVPILASALASFDCKVTDVADGHSHDIFIGEVITARAIDGNDNPLLYAHGSYGTFKANEA